jgi:ribose 5-phosphate isomerase B
MKEATIFLGSDHAGFELKEKIKSYLSKSFYGVEDLGPHSFNKEDDYSDFIIPVAEKVAKTKNSFGIILGGSGQGEAIVANKVKGVRAAVFYGGDKKILRLSKQHNDANILSLGARFLSEKEALSAVKLWLSAKFSNEPRHKRRIKKIENYEK